LIAEIQSLLILYFTKTGQVRIADNVHSFAVGGAILLRRPWRRALNCDTKDKILFKSQMSAGTKAK